MLTPRPSQRFAQLDDLSKQEHEAQNTRIFEGTGNSFLPIDPIIGLSSIRIGLHHLPLVEERDYPINGQMQTEKVNEPLVEIQTSSDNKQQYLVRSILSNDGIWPLGTKIYVTGEWRSEAPAAPAVPVQDFTTMERIAEMQSPSNPNHIEDQAHRERVALETGDNRALTNEGVNPTIVDPVGAVTGVNTPVVAEALTELSAELMEKVRALGTPTEALAADNKRYNELGIAGGDIVRVKNALRKALTENSTAE
jgi:hypothetical protein